MIGPLPPPFGGATVLFEQLAADLRDIAHIKCVNTNERNSRTGRRTGAVKVILEIIRHRRDVDFISFHASIRGALLFGPVVALIAKMQGVPWSLRIFGGGVDDWLSRRGVLSNSAFRWLSKLPAIIFVERKSTVELLNRANGVNSTWLPNSRPLREDNAKSSDTSRPDDNLVRFIFIGHVKPSKGVYEVVQAARLLGDRQFTVDIYGPLQEGVAEAELNQHQCRYKGELNPADVPAVMKNNDVLLLPTYWRGEGYPGVIIEAFGCGLAVLATQWGGIPEIVSPKEGILVPPRDARALADAMQLLIDSPERRGELKAGAREAAKAFSSKAWSQFFLDCHKNWRDMTR